LRFWEQARESAGLAPNPVPEAWGFGDSPEMADTLLALVLSGAKTATAALLWEYRDDGVPVPQAGELAIILDGEGNPQALIRDTDVSIVAFDQVGARHAHDEGEGDLTLEYWRAAHWEFWQSNYAGENALSGEMPVVCEQFEVLYRNPAAA
jgi:uncharacterized protein YhfF